MTDHLQQVFRVYLFFVYDLSVHCRMVALVKDGKRWAYIDTLNDGVDKEN